MLNILVFFMYKKNAILSFFLGALILAAHAGPEAQTPRNSNKSRQQAASKSVNREEHNPPTSVSSSVNPASGEAVSLIEEEKPSLQRVVLVAGPWMDSTVLWAPVKKSLESRQCEVVVVDLQPGEGTDPASLRKENQDLIRKAVGDSRGVILVAHGTAGIPVTLSVEELDAHIAKVVYIGALLPEGSQSVGELLASDAADALSSVIVDSEGKSVTPDRFTVPAPIVPPTPVTTEDQKAVAPTGEEGNSSPSDPSSPKPDAVAEDTKPAKKKDKTSPESEPAGGTSKTPVLPSVYALDPTKFRKLLGESASSPLTDALLEKLRPMPGALFSSSTQVGALGRRCWKSYVFLTKDTCITPVLQERMAAAAGVQKRHRIAAGFLAPIEAPEDIATLILRN